MRAETRTPSRVAVRGPRSNNGAPGKVTGTTSHKKRTKPFTSIRRLSTLRTCNPENPMSMMDATSPGTNAEKRSDRAVTKANAVAIRIRNRGSSRWNGDASLTKGSRIMSDHSLFSGSMSGCALLRGNTDKAVIIPSITMTGTWAPGAGTTAFKKYLSESKCVTAQ